MIEQNTKIHDNYSLEIKLGFNARKKKKVSEFAVNTWIFIPKSLDINTNTYDKKDFYRDIKSNIRLTTPVYLLRDLAKSDSIPMRNLVQSFKKVASSPSRTNISAYEYQIKMFLSIIKSSLRDEAAHITKNKLKEDFDYLVDNFKLNIEKITQLYRELRHIINVPTINKKLLNHYLLGDEFISNLIEQQSFRLLSYINIKEGKTKENNGRKILLELINSETKYKEEKGYPIIKKDSPDNNRSIVQHFNSLKKYAENVLFLSTRKKRDGVVTEQLYYSIAAGISMVFATAIAFSMQLKYGNFTMPLFVALVVSYMLKDRIKELGRYYFAHHLGRRYFDHKTYVNLNSNNIGWRKEAMDFISESKVPEEVMNIRDRSSILETDNWYKNERIVLFRKLIRLNRKKLNQCSEYNLSGINEIIRFNISSYTNKMDNPSMPLHILGNGGKPKTIQGERTYLINIVMQLKYDGKTTYKRYRLTINRQGIKEIEKF